MWLDRIVSRARWSWVSGGDEDSGPATMARLIAIVTALTAAAYTALTTVAAVWGSLTLTRPRRSRLNPSVRLRHALAGSPSPIRGDEPLWHPAVALTAWSTTGSEAVLELAGAAVDVPGLWGLEWHDGDGRHNYAQLGEVTARCTDEAAVGGRVVRRRARMVLGDVCGSPPRPETRTEAALCAYAWPDDLDVLQRELASGGARVVVREVGIASTGGLFPATLIEPDQQARADAGDTWVIAVHGRGSRRAQVYRMAALLSRCGATTVAITYRGDCGTPDERGRSALGASEWLEVESAVSYALTRGARRIVLYGFSMGGAVGTAFLRRSPLAPAVTALVLDAPVLDWGPVLRSVAGRLRLPRPAVPLTMLLSRWLAGADFALVNRLLPPPRPWEGDARRPTLLIHGTDDPVVPVCSSDALAAAEPNVVRYLRVEGAGHTTAYNYAPTPYAFHLSAFLTDVLAGPTAPTNLRVDDQPGIPQHPTQASTAA